MNTHIKLAPWFLQGIGPTGWIWFRTHLGERLDLCRRCRRGEQRPHKHDANLNQFQREARCIVWYCREAQPSTEAAIAAGWEAFDPTGYPDADAVLFRCPKHRR